MVGLPSDLSEQAQHLCTQTPGCTQAQVLMSATGLEVQRIVRMNVRTSLSPKAEQQARDRLAAALPQARHVRLAVHFTPPPGDGKRSWLEAARPQILSGASTTAMIRRRLAEGDWRSPLVYLGVVRAYAETTYGPTWDRPNSTVEG